MAYSYVRYTGNGSTQNYTFSFPYINQDHIKVRVNGVITTAWSFLSASTVQFTSAPASGAIIEIRRETPKDSAIVNFTDGSVLLERDLDLLATYDLYLAQETKDGLDSSITQTSLGVFDAQSKRITNVADPVNAQDAVTKNWVATTYTAEIAATAAASAASATASANSSAAALASANAAALSYDAFDDRYLGSKAVAPSVDNDGNALLVGAVYWDTGSNQMFTWDGSAWKPTFVTGNTVRSLVVATAGQTIVVAPTYVIGNSSLQVYLNGVKQVVTSDYTETSQSSITFASGLTVGDEVELIAFQAYPVGTTSAQNVSWQQAGTGATTRTVDAKLKEFVSVKDFGAVGDGVADDTTAIANAIATGKNVYFPSGNYLLTSLLSITAQNQELCGEGNSSRIFSALTTPIRLLTCSNVKFDRLFFETTSAGSSVYGIVYAENAALADILFSQCKFRAATANTNAVKIINEGVNLSERLAFVGCEFLDIGRMGIEFQNHNDGDQVYRIKDVTVDRCTFKNIGLISNGMGVSLSGYGQQGAVTNCRFSNCRNIGVELVGFRDFLVQGNTFEGFDTYAYSPISGTGSRRAYGLTVSNNKVLGSNAGRWNLYTIDNSTFSGNLLRSGYFFLRDTNDCIFRDNHVYQKASDAYAFFIEGTSARNKIISCHLDGTASTVANQGTIFHNGSGVVDNVYRDCRIIKSAVSGAITIGSSINTRIEECVVDGVLYESYTPVFVRKGTLQITSVAGVSKLTISGFSGGSWSTRLIRFSVTGIANDSTGRVAAARQIEVRGQGTNTPTVGGTTTLIESNCTITYSNTSQTLVIVCTNSTAANAIHRWEWEVVGPAVGDVTIST